jgi:hypothetical protein
LRSGGAIAENALEQAVLRFPARHFAEFCRLSRMRQSDPHVRHHWKAMDTHKQLNNSDRIVFSAALPKAMRPEVEALFFFNPRQPLLHEGIHAAIAHAGMPAITESEDKVWIDVPSGKTQCVFACDESVEPVRAIGVVLYTRPVVDTIWITHLAIDPDYQYRGENAKLNVATRLVDRVMAVAHSIKGITRIQLPYRDGRYLHVKRPESSRSDQPAG